MMVVTGYRASQILPVGNICSELPQLNRSAIKMPPNAVVQGWLKPVAGQMASVPIVRPPVRVAQ